MNLFTLGLMLTVLVFIGIPFLIFVASALFAGGWISVVTVAALVIVAFLVFSVLA